MSKCDLVEISIVIDDNNTLTFKVNINKSDIEYIMNLCNELVNKYKLSEQVKKKLFIQLSDEINKIKDIKKEKKLKKENINNSISKNEIFNKLYYEDLNKKKERELLQEQLKQKKIEEEMKNYSFTPQIKNYYKLKNYYNNNQNIGDKLYSQRKKKFGPNNKLHRVINNNFNIEKNEADFNIDLSDSKNEKKRGNFIELNQYISNDSQFNNISSIEDKQLSRNSSQTKKNFKLINNREKLNSANMNNQKENNKNNFNYRYNQLLKDFQDNKKKILINKNKINNIKNNVNSSINDNYNSNNLYNSINSINKVNEKTLYKGKNSKSEKKLRTYYLNSCEKYNQNYFDKLHNDKVLYDKKQNKKTKEYYSKNYTFEPKISRGSQILMSNRNESNEEFYNRLSSTKKFSTLKNYYNKIYKNSTQKTNKTLNNCNSNKRLKTNNTNITEKLNNPLSINVVYLDKKSNIQLKTEQNMIKKLEDLEKEKKFKEELYKKTVNSNIENYKLNEIKTLYEILIENNINFDILYKKGIPKHIINKVVKPTCYMINDKQLEFNFQNFYLICNELLEKFF